MKGSFQLTRLERGTTTQDLQENSKKLTAARQSSRVIASGEERVEQGRRVRKLRRGQPWDAKAQAAQRSRVQTPRRPPNNGTDETPEQDIPLSKLARGGTTKDEEFDKYPGKSIFVRKMLEGRAQEKAEQPAGRSHQQGTSDSTRSLGRVDRQEKLVPAPSMHGPKVDPPASASEPKSPSEVGQEGQTARGRGRRQSFKTTGSQQAPRQAPTGQKTSDARKWQGLQGASRPGKAGQGRLQRDSQSRSRLDKSDNSRQYTAAAHQHNARVTDQGTAALDSFSVANAKSGPAQPPVTQDPPSKATHHKLGQLNLNPWRQEPPGPSEPKGPPPIKGLRQTALSLDGESVTNQQDLATQHANTEEDVAALRVPAPIQSIRREASGSTATFFSSSSLEECGVVEGMAQALGTLGIQRPSNIQAAAIEALSNEKLQHAVIADHAGSGKTLAYLIPLIQQLKTKEQELGKRVSKPGCPFAVIVLPTAELCMQVAGVARAISQAGQRFTSISMTGGYKKITQRDRLREGVDIVIGTPGRLNMFVEEGELKLHSTQFVVLDEVDILLGDASLFAEQVQPLQRAASQATKFVLVTASLPEHTWMDLQLQFPGVRPLLGPGLHRPAPGSLEQLVDCSGGDVINEETGFQQKFAGLLNVLLGRQVSRTLIFCNKLQTCRKVENAIKRTRALQHMSALPYHTGIDPALRDQNMASFLTSKGEDEQLVMISTDRASRGIDTSNVGHVVLFDFPRDPSEYVRRAGRTARGAGGKGVVSLLVLGRQVQLARQILAKTEKGLPLHDIPIA